MAFKVFKRRDEECGVFVAYIPSLAIYTQAKTEETLVRAAKSAIKSFIEICHERGTMHHVTKPKEDRRWPGNWTEFFVDVNFDFTLSLN